MGIDYATKSDAEIAKLIAQCLKFIDDPKLGETAVERLEHSLTEARLRAVDGSGFVPMLAAMGYNVRHKQLTGEERAAILGNIFRAELPFLNSEVYMQSWGAPGSEPRLREIYDTIHLYLSKYGYQVGSASERWAEDLSLLEQFAREEGWSLR